MTPSLVVIGSANMDLVVRSAHIAAPGETVLGEAFRQIPGGKGANQAVAAARLGAAVTFVGRVGNDLFGEALRSGMQADSIDTTYLQTDPTEPTGVALIGVDAQGQNAITVASGANFQVSAQDIDQALPIIRRASAILLQLEIPRETVLYATQQAHDAGIPVILNPAPASLTDPLPDSLLAQIDVLTPNEYEASALLGLEYQPESDWAAIANLLLTKGVKAVVITLGEDGCLVADSTGSQHIPAIAVNAVDTTAAGDCFTGALSVALAEGRSLEEAAQFAAQAAAISVTRSGAQPSLPTRSEVDASSVTTSRLTPMPSK
ncbi:MAG: rbsK [Chthonomonadales bacterium]|nr:rbsK [Chthonomonadales bacterium]